MRVEGSWLLHLNYQPFARERLFRYDVAIIQIQGTGAAYSGRDGIHKSELDSIVGNDARKILKNEYSPVNIALLDAMYASLSPEPDADFLISGRNKAGQRADIVCNEVQNLRSRELIPARPKVVNVGAIGCIIEKLEQRQMQVTASDLDKDLIGSELAGVKIADGALHTEKMVAEADLALVTGMTACNGSLPGILATAKANATRVMMIAETGAGFGRAYCDLLDVDVVVSEPYPFYIFNCYSQILIYRKAQNADRSDN
ncbi:MAG: DUF364 domain-containing protein, partial [Victivallales bacterium]|nr:DUF364 domain-containing protein [Victivallales bacterium]